MSLIRCENGHYYDDQKFDKCPHCGITLTGAKIMQSNIKRSNDTDKTIAKISNDNKTVAFNQNRDDDIKTVGIFHQTNIGEPVVGWLVCVNGKEYGRDYRLHSGRNFVGRSPKSDICIMEDSKISREKHASIVYDPMSNRFSVVPGENTWTQLNGEIVSKVMQIKDDDLIAFGTSEFQFIAFCKGDRKWQY